MTTVMNAVAEFIVSHSKGVSRGVVGNGNLLTSLQQKLVLKQYPSAMSECVAVACTKGLA